MKDYSDVADSINKKLTKKEREFSFIFVLSYVSSLDNVIAERVAKRLGMSNEAIDAIVQRGRNIGADALQAAFDPLYERKY